MTFDDILDQVIALLKRQGRVSYSALKRRFNLDEDYLNDLKDELLYVHPVIDDEGRGLVWTGDTASAQAVAAQPPQAIHQPAAQEQHSSQIESFSTVPPIPDAERRQLTVMFCDLVDSTRLSSQLDPEDYREVVRLYQATCTEVMQRYDGHIAQLLGDGLLVYFGYPVAHEDDAQRAVRSGLGIIESLKTLNTRLEPDQGVRLAVRLGIHTGLVVVGAMGSAGRQEQLALGEVPNVAARLQGLAEPDTVVVSSATYGLIQGYFTCQALAAQPLRGVAEPIGIYRVIGDSGAQSRLDIISTGGLTPLVGRESEVTLLLERWEQAKNGQGQIILLSGEGGIGKSRLVQVLKDHVAHEPHTRWECRSSPYYQNTFLYPLTDFFHRALQWQPEDTPDEKLEKLVQQLRQYRFPVAETVPLFASLLSLTLPEERYAPLTLSPQRQRQKTLESIVAIILELAERQPVLFILEDLHWTDPSTLALLDLLIDQTPTASLLTLLTCRPTFQPSWSHRSYLTEVTVNCLSRQQIERMVAHVAGGKRLPAEVLQQIVEKTDGVPLFVEEMTKAILESGYLRDVDGQYVLAGSLPSLAIPSTLQDSLMARLDRLVTAKAVAQYAAVIGRQCSYALLQAVTRLDVMTLQRELGRLVEAELLYQRGLPPQATYIFKHALIQDAAYQSLLKSTRQQYHQRIAQTLEAQFPEIIETQPELLAHHYTEAGDIEPAIRYWYSAGERAIQLSAYVEAIAHLNTGLELLQRLPHTRARLQQELDVQIALGAAFIATKGYIAAEVDQVYTRAHELCQQVGDTAQLFWVLHGLETCYYVRAELRKAREIGTQLLHIAQCQHAPEFFVPSYFTLGAACWALGELVPAQHYLEQTLTYYAPQQHHAYKYITVHPMVVSLSLLASVLWFRGYPAQALHRRAEVMALVQELSHPISTAYCLYNIIRLYILRRELPTVQALSEELVALCTQQGFS